MPVIQRNPPAITANHNIQMILESNENVLIKPKKNGALKRVKTWYGRLWFKLQNSLQKDTPTKRINNILKANLQFFLENRGKLLEKKTKALLRDSSQKKLTYLLKAGLISEEVHIAFRTFGSYVNNHISMRLNALPNDVRGLLFRYLTLQDLNQIHTLSMSMGDLVQNFKNGRDKHGIKDLEQLLTDPHGRPLETLSLSHETKREAFFISLFKLPVHPTTDVFWTKIFAKFSYANRFKCSQNLYNQKKMSTPLLESYEKLKGELNSEQTARIRKNIIGMFLSTYPWIAACYLKGYEKIANSSEAIAFYKKAAENSVKSEIKVVSCSDDQGDNRKPGTIVEIPINAERWFGFRKINLWQNPAGEEQEMPEVIRNALVERVKDFVPKCDSWKLPCIVFINNDSYKSSPLVPYPPVSP